MDMKKLLEAVTKFSGEEVGQKPGDQWRGTDKGTPGKKLVGASENVLKDLSKGATPKTKEQELAEQWAKFMEDDLGTHPKRPGRKSDRPTRGHKELPRYKTIKSEGKVKDLSIDLKELTDAEFLKKYKKTKQEMRTALNEGWGTGSDRVSLPDTPDTYYSGTGQLQKEYDALYAELVPSMGKADTIEGEVLRAASKIVYRHYNDGDEFNQASFDQLEKYIGHVTSYDDLAHKATMFAAAAEGEYHPNTGWDSLDVMEYGPEEEDEDDDYDDYAEYPDEDEDIREGGVLKSIKRGLGQQGVAEAAQGHTIEAHGVRGMDRRTWHKTFKNADHLNAWAEKYDAEIHGTRDLEQAQRGNLSPAITGVSEGAADIYSITSERNGRERSKSGTLAELIEYYGYTLETGKSYEHERGNKKINLNPKNIESLVQNLNNAKNNAAANGRSSERFYVDHGNMAESRTTWNNDFYVYDPKTKAVKKKFRTHKGAKQYAEANGLKVASAEYYHDSVSKQVDEGMEEFAKSQAKQRAEKRKSIPWPKEVPTDAEQERNRTRDEKENDPHPYIYPPERVREARDKYDSMPMSWRERDDARRADIAAEIAAGRGDEAYRKYVAKQKQSHQRGWESREGWEQNYTGKSPVKEGWGGSPGAPDDRPRVERDPDAEYDAMRTAKADDEMMAQQARRPQTKVYTLTGRGPNMEPNYAFPGEYDSQAAADAARTKLMADPKTPNPTMIGISTRTKYLDENESTVKYGVFAKGGSIGDHNNSKPYRVFDTKEEAIACARRYRSQLTPGERGYYKMGFVTKAIKEGIDTPLKDKEDYAAKRKSLQDLQTSPGTSKDPELKAEVARRMAVLMKQAKDLGIDEGRAHKVLNTWFKNHELQKKFASGEVKVPTPQERKAELEKTSKKKVTEYGADNPQLATAATTKTAAQQDPKQAAAIQQATNTLKAATGSTVPTTNLVKAIDAASQGKSTGQQDMKALEPLMKDVATIAQTPQLAGQLKSVLSQVQQVQRKQTT